jgi:alkylresorcinol/alkylpyrone synthase
MGWRIEDDGMAVEFGPSLPVLVRQRLRRAAEAFLAKSGHAPSDLDGVVCHPGGPRILGAMEESFSDCADGLEEARATLREFGNMSAATVLFVLRRSLDRGCRGRRLLSAIGPGFTAGFVLLSI